MTQIELLAQLDDDQRAAVIAPLRNNLCIANAGSGKTRVLTYRIAFLIMQGVPDSSFLMLTFTNKAAKEMLGRVRDLLGDSKIGITGGTFHSVACRFLRKYGKMIGIPSDFSILDENDATDLMGVCREEFCADNGFSRDDFPFKKWDLMEFYSYCRNCMLSFKTGNEYLEMFTPEMLDMLAQDLFPLYESRKQKMRGLDFDDLLIYFDNLLSMPDFLNYIHKTKPNVFVDEYQDINALQNSIIHKLAKDVNHVTAVGDEAQCIYGFRGSEIQFIQDFTKEFPNTTVYPIRNNYRSSPNIVDLAVKVINKSPYYRENPKVMVATQTGKYIPAITQAFDDEEQAAIISYMIRDAYRRGIPYHEIAVLFRTNFLARIVEARLTADGIPVQMECGIGFYERLHIRAVLNFLKFVNNRKNEMAFWSIFETVEGIGSVTSKKMFETFNHNGCNLAELSMLKVPKRATSGFSSVVDSICRAVETSSLTEQMSFFLNGYYKSRMRMLFAEDYQLRYKDFEILENILSMYPTLTAFLDSAALDKKENNKDDDTVTITTVHKAKGLEWDKVILPYMNEGVFPYTTTLSKTEKEIEEERRLLYVAMTRAKQELSLIEVMYSERAKILGSSSFLKNCIQRSPS